MSSATAHRQARCWQSTHRSADCIVSRRCIGRRRSPNHVRSLPGMGVLADVIIQQAPTNSAATQNQIQNLLTSVPEPVKEAPERLIIAVSLTAVAVVGYLLREKFKSE